MRFWRPFWYCSSHYGAPDPIEQVAMRLAISGLNLDPALFPEVADLEWDAAEELEEYPVHALALE